jgi:biotin transport system substrate-specific component
MTSFAKRWLFGELPLVDRIAWSIFFALATGACTQIAIHLPFTPIPVTLQVLAVLLSGLVLGSRWGAISQIQYLAMGAIGMPVFAGFKAGAAAFFGPTGGYLLGFVAGAYVAGLIFERLQNSTRLAAFIAGVAGILAIYSPGFTWLSVWLRFSGVGSIGGALHGAFVMGVAPFIVVDALKAVAAASLATGGRWGRGLIRDFRGI